MNKSSVNQERIVDRLWFYNYSYRLEGSLLTIYLPMLCAVRILFEEDRVKISSHLRGAYFFDQIEYVFLSYLGLLFLMAYFAANPLVYAFLGFIFIYLVICFIKTEVMKSIVLKWMEGESLVS